MSRGRFLQVIRLQLLALVLGGLCMALPAGAQPMPPGGPGDAGDSGRRILADNRSLDSRLDGITRSIRNGQADYDEARQAFRNAVAQALDLKSRSLDLGSDRASTLLLSAMRLQVQRCQELLRATEYEDDYGVSAAAQLWQDEAKTYYRYRDALSRAAWAYER